MKIDPPVPGAEGAEKEERTMLDTLCRWWQKLHPGNPERRQGCMACGVCCEQFGGYLHASKADLERWQLLGRDDLLALVSPFGWIWVDPLDGRRGAPCPFLQRIDEQVVCCAIHDIKPDMCRAYPGEENGRHCVRGVYIPRPSPRKEPDALILPTRETARRPARRPDIPVC
jgi:Fe-S-cluster containining protein